jgi:iron complex transport system substrate-binding protein
MNRPQLYHPAVMNQRTLVFLRLQVLWLALGLAAGCGDAPVAGDRPRREEAGGGAGRTTFASLVPAATDLLIGMGLGEHVVAVSNYDVDRPATRGLPRVGDYQTTDWERLGALRPDVMIVQIAPDRIPAGLVQRAEQQGIRLMNVEINRLEDVLRTVEELGQAAGRKDVASGAVGHLRDRLEAVAERVAGREPVRTLMVSDATGRHIVGPNTFLDDLLQVAGGTNAAAWLGKPYPTIEREMLLEMRPEAVIQLLPAAPEQVVETARRFWPTMPQVPAVAAGRVYMMTEWYALQPGWHVADLAEAFASHLHPEAR